IRRRFASRGKSLQRQLLMGRTSTFSSTNTRSGLPWPPAPLVRSCGEASGWRASGSGWPGRMKDSSPSFWKMPGKGRRLRVFGSGSEVAGVAHYIVRARLKQDLARELKEKLDAGEFRSIRPFGMGLSDALEKARKDPQTGEAVWEEQCFCNPPLA